MSDFLPEVKAAALNRRGRHESAEALAKMQLRYHPIMFCDGVKVWPPKWLQTHGRGMVRVSGEVGVLEAVFLSEVEINKVYLQISTEQGNGYLGILPFETADRAKAVFNFLSFTSTTHSKLSAQWISPIHQLN